MSGEGEIIGDIAQSVLIARAAEPVHGESADGHSAEAACLNCGTALVGSHCHACGQAAHVRAAQHVTGGDEAFVVILAVHRKVTGGEHDMRHHFPLPTRSLTACIRFQDAI